MTIHNLNEDQLKAATAPSLPLLIVAGAGTGKTRTLTSRIFHLIREGVPPDKICALTFTNKAAKEMLDRVWTLLQEEPPREGLRLKMPAKIWRAQPPFIGTFHSLGAGILRRYPDGTGRGRNFTIYDSNDSFRLVKKSIEMVVGKKSGIKPASVLSLISAVKNEMIALADAGDDECDNKVFRSIFSAYEEDLLKNNAFDFDDLIGKVVWLFRKNPSVVGYYRDKYSHFLVDEYQDINDVQYEMVKILAGLGKNLSVVGDHNQTIYSWRGSNIGIFMNFKTDWQKSSVVFLGKNYRSTSNIVGAAAALIKNSPQPKGLTTNKLWTENGAGDPVKIIESNGESDEADKIVRLAAEASARNLSAAILYRTNAQSRSLEQALIEKGLPYLVFGGIKFYERKEVKDLVSALRIAHNPEDSVSHERLAKNLGKNRFSRGLETLVGRSNKNPAELIDSFLKATSYFALVDRSLTNPEERKENIAELISFATKFDNLGEFLEKVSLLQAVDNLTEGKDENKIILMTVHLAKGLEFDSVFLAGFNEGTFPHHRSLGNAAELEEERRLAYVAMTRARKNLTISFFNIPSRFLSELPSEFIDFDGGVKFEDEERYITLD